MMTAQRILEHTSEWEKQARATKSERMWDDYCTRIWTAEFILGTVHETGYIQPHVRIPKPSAVLETAK